MPDFIPSADFYESIYTNLTKSRVKDNILSLIFPEYNYKV